MGWYGVLKLSFRDEIPIRPLQSVNSDMMKHLMTRQRQLIQQQSHVLTQIEAAQNSTQKQLLQSQLQQLKQELHMIESELGK